MGTLSSSRSRAPIAPGDRSLTGRASGLPPLLVLVPLGCSLLLLGLVGPELAFRPSIPSDTDLPGHVLPVELLRTELIPRGHIRGWSHDWFAGFPAYFFYFPLPGLVAALLGWVMEPALALRVVTLVGPLALPWALYAFGKWSGMSRGTVTGLVVGGSAFLLTTSFHVLGGNLLSTLAGEFCYSWGLVLSVVYLGLIARGSSGTLAGLVLTAAMLSHVLPAGAAALASMVGLARREWRRPLLISWVVGAGLTAFWALPLARNLDLVGRAGWTFVPGRADILPLELLLLLPAAGLGLWLLRTRPSAWLLVAAGVAGLLAAVVPQTLIMRGRLIPVWMLAVHALAGAGIGHALSRQTGGWRVAALVLGLAPWTLVATLRGTADVRAFSVRVLEGIPASPRAADVESLVADLRSRPPGRLYGEASPDANDWGGPYTFALIPYWTDHTSLDGLWAESASLSDLMGSLEVMLAGVPPENPYRDPVADGVEYDPVRGLGVLRALGVRYFVTVSERTRTAVGEMAGVSTLGRFGRFTLLEIGAGRPVVATTCVAPVHEDDLPDPMGWIVAWRPEAPWSVAASEGVATNEAPRVCPDSGKGRVTDVELLPDRIRFRTDAPGTPHLVRSSYFPNWKAVGAAGPFRAAPAFMVVVPEERDVTLEFGSTWVERLGGAITWATALLLIPMVLRRRVPEVGPNITKRIRSFQNRGREP